MPSCILQVLALNPLKVSKCKLPMAILKDGFQIITPNAIKNSATVAISYKHLAVLSAHDFSDRSLHMKSDSRKDCSMLSVLITMIGSRVLQNYL